MPALQASGGGLTLGETKSARVGHLRGGERAGRAQAAGEMPSCWNSSLWRSVGRLLM